MLYQPNKTLLRDRKRWRTEQIRRWRIRWTEMYIKDRNSAATNEKVTNWRIKLLLSQFFWLLLGSIGSRGNVEQPFDCLIVQKRQAVQQARNQLGSPGEEKSFLRGAQIFWTIGLSHIFKLYPTHFSRGAKILLRGLRPPCATPSYVPAVQSMRRSMDWTVEDNTVDGLFSCATLTRAEEVIPHLYKQPDTGVEAVKPDPGSSWEGHSGGVEGGCENAESCRVVRTLRVPFVIRPVRRMYVVVVRWTDELLCGGHKWDSIWGAAHLHSMDGSVHLHSMAGSVHRVQMHGASNRDTHL